MDSDLNKKIVFLKRQDFIALFCFAAGIIFFIWKAPYSYGLEDESIYYTVPLRLVMGDSLLVDEWNQAQLFAFLMYLPVKAYMHFVGSTEGMMLFFRYVYVAFQSTASVLIYYRLRKYGVFSVLAAAIYYLHIPLTFILLSYNTMGFAFVSLAGVLMSTTKKHSGVTYFIIGLLISCAVICNPFLSFVYLAYSICVIISEVTKNKKWSAFEFSKISFSYKTWLWITFGVLTVAILFIWLIFSRTTIKEIIDNSPMFYSDTKYQRLSKVNGEQSVFTFPKALGIIFQFSPYLFSAFGILIAAAAFDKKRIAHRALYLLGGCAAYTILMFQILLAPIMPPDAPFYFWMMPLSILGFICYLLSEKRDKNTIAFLWILGIIYSVCLGISSDIPQFSLVIGLGVSDLASVIFIYNIVNEIRKQPENITNKKLKKNAHKWSREFMMPKAVTSLLIFSLLFQVGSQLYINADVNRYSQEYAFDEYFPSTEKLNVNIDEGPLKGVKTTAHTAMLYKAIIADLSIIKKESNKKGGYGPVLVTGYFPWCYLYLNLPYAAYASEINNYIGNDRLAKYYELHPDKMPKYIYVPKIGRITLENAPEYIEESFLYDKAENIVADIDANYTCKISETDVGYIVIILNESELL